MPPTVIVPWFTPCCGLAVLLVGLAAAGEPLLPEPAFAPEPDFAAGALCATGAAPPLVGCAVGVLPLLLPLLDGVGVPAVAPPLGVTVPELPAEGEVYAWPATASV